MKIPKVIEELEEIKDMENIVKNIAKDKNIKSLAEMLKQDYFYYTMPFAELLSDAVNGMEEIPELIFKQIQKEYKYEFYCYDKRIECLRFIFSDYKNTYKNKAYLLISTHNLADIKKLKNKWCKR